MSDNLWLILGIGALLIAGFFAVVVPRKSKVSTLHGATYFIVRWMHSLIWLALAISFFMRAVSNPAVQGLADPLAAAAGIGYLIYITTLMSVLKP